MVEVWRLTFFDFSGEQERCRRQEASVISREIPEAYLREVAVDYVDGSEDSFGTVMPLFVQVENLLDDVAPVRWAEDPSKNFVLAISALPLRFLRPFGVELNKESLIGQVRIGVEVVVSLQFLLNKALRYVGRLSELSHGLADIFCNKNFILIHKLFLANDTRLIDRRQMLICLNPAAVHHI